MLLSTVLRLYWYHCKNRHLILTRK